MNPVSIAQTTRQGHISWDMIATARSKARSNGKDMMSELKALASSEPAEFSAMLAQTLKMRRLSRDDVRDLAIAPDLINSDDAQMKRCFAARIASGDIIVAIVNPFDERLQSWLESRIRSRFTLALVDEDTFLSALTELHPMESYAVTSQSSAHGDSAHDEPDADVLSPEAIRNSTSEAVRAVKSAVFEAIRLDASDIHFSANRHGLLIKFRIDGVLEEVTRIAEKKLGEQVISRIKVLSNLDISERRIPQDGRYRVLFGDVPIDVRVSIMPSHFGEDAVLRLLDKRAIVSDSEQLSLKHLGFSDSDVALLRRLSRAPHGMILITGPTGSGKTTTLYALISESNSGKDKIVTIEDPIEYQLPDVLQVPVNEKKGLSFARGLRSILRHDPDRIMVGEIRDPETAEIAVQAAMTGHLVYTTVHANNVFDVIGRFVHMHIDLHSFVGALNAVVAQRLIRLRCAKCANIGEPACGRPGGHSDISGTRPPHEVTNAESRLCSNCRGTQYQGRQAISETLVLNDELRELIVARASTRQLKEVAAKNGFRTLRQTALALVSSGRTTMEEVNRVAFEFERSDSVS